MYRLRYASWELKHRFSARLCNASTISSSHWTQDESVSRVRSNSCIQSCIIDPQRATHIPVVNFSTRPAETGQDKEISLRKLIDRRRKKLRKERQQQRKSERQLPLDLTLHRQQDFEDLFDQLAPMYSKAKMRQVMKKIRMVMKDTPIALSSALRTTLHATPPNDSLQRSILEYLLSVAPSAPHQPRPSPSPEVSQVLLRSRKRAWAESVSWDKGGAKPIIRVADGLSEDEEAAKVVELLHANLPMKYLHSFVDLLREYSGSDMSFRSHENSTETNKPGSKIRNFSSHLSRRFDSHYHRVAPVIADFFGYDPQMIETDAKFVESHEKWKLFRQEFTSFLLYVQERIFDETNQHSPIVGAHAGVEDIDSDTLHPSEPVISSEALQVDRRFRRPIHVVLEAVRLQKPPSSMPHPTLHGENHLSIPTETMVFLDNLPIDITNETVRELYSRCGDVERVQIFNQRPDLDPGPLSKTQLVARRRSRFTTTSRFRKWQRPRSPVYALVVFRTHEGYQACINDALRIFGMLIQKHPVRSIPAKDMKRLFLEGLDGRPCLDLEYQLGEQLGPELLVCLGAGQNNRGVVGSCEIRFPTFEDAFESFGKLRDLSKVQSQFAVNWMRTPKDAELWFSRKRGFE